MITLRLVPLVVASAATMLGIRFAPVSVVPSVRADVQPVAPLRVIHASPTGVASPVTEITVSFDRPVAGSLERAVDPAKILQLSPALPGRFEWRDPVTVRFLPTGVLAADLRVTVTVTTDFAAMDGSRLESPYHFAFRVRGPVALAGTPVGDRQTARHIVPNQRFEVVYSDSVDATRLGEAAFLEMSSVCTARIIRLRVGGQRRIVKDDSWELQSAGGWNRDSKLDSLRRVVSLFPRSPIPRDCAGDLVVPQEVSPGASGALQRWAFRTFGSLKLETTVCRSGSSCPRGPIGISFSNPVSGSQVQRSVRVFPAVPFVVRDTTAIATDWTLEAELKPRSAYAVVVDTAIRDIFGQPVTGNPAGGFRTTGYEPYVNYPYGKQTVERVGFNTLPIEHANADTLVAMIAPVPTGMEPEFLARFSWGYQELWQRVASSALTRRIPTTAGLDRGSLTGLTLPVPDATRTGSSTLFAVKVGGTALTPDNGLGTATLSLVQITDLGVTARLGVEEGAVWVTGVSDGLPRAGAEVTLHGADGRVLAIARTDAQGLARLSNFSSPINASGANEDDEGESSPEGGYVAVRLGADRALVAVNNYDPDLSSWTFGVSSAWGAERFPVTGAVFAERGIYRPGEQVHLKAIARTGMLGALRRPERSDSLKWIFTDREGNEFDTRTVALSEFGTSQQALSLPAGVAVGTQRVRVKLKRRGAWLDVASTSFRVGEYRPPEFLIDLGVRTPPSGPGSTFRFAATARYLFGAPMAGAAVNWEAREERLSAWDLRIPGTDGWQLGRNEWGWYDAEEQGFGTFSSGVDTLDARGERVISVQLPTRVAGGPTRVTVAAAVTDVNRQVVGGTTSTVMHPAQFYLAARVAGSSWFWKAGEAQRIAVRAVRPDGAPATGVKVVGRLIRREWHRVRRERDGIAEMVGEWVTDTVGTCDLVTTTAGSPVCVLTPVGGGVHRIVFTATDGDGHESVTSFGRWVSGPDFVPWSDETQFKMDVLADRDRYSVGDTATILLASPFTDAEAWVTVEREQVLEQRRLRITSGAQTIKIPITEAFAPNVFVSVVVVRGRSAPPGKLDDPGRPTMRVGYVELRVTPEVKRLKVQMALGRSEYRPGDTAQVRLAVRDAQGVGARAEVTLWAVDEGVLALTGYKTPDPLDLVYRPRGLGMRLASNLVAVTPQVAEGEKGRREAGGGGGADGAEVLRSRFQTTAFFLGDVVTDAAGNADVKAKLPDNLTTFRLMAVVVTAGDRYGSGESPLLVTRPVVARPALPRFVRAGDSLLAGTVVNRRDGAVSQVAVKATVEGIRLTEAAQRTVPLTAGRGSEARFRFVATPGDSATFRFDVQSGRDVDAVRVKVPVRPDYHPRAHTLAGVLHDTATVEFLLPADIDPARSRLTLSLGSSPLTIVRGIQGSLRVYPYECTEQISSRVTPLLAMLRAQSLLSPEQRATALREVARGVGVLLGRQRADGGIGYWGPGDWTTPWLSAYAAGVLVEARDVGVEVDSAALARLAEYLRSSLREVPRQNTNPLAWWYDHRATRLADQVAAADFLSRLGAPELPAENELVRNAPQMRREDRIRLAEIVARRGATGDARRLLVPIWSQVVVEGRTATLPPSEPMRWYFHSTVRETAGLLTATLLVDPSHALVGPLVERLALEERGSERNTQDRAAAVRALALFEAKARAGGPRQVLARSGTRVIAQIATASGDTTVTLESLLGPARGEVRPLRLALRADGDAKAPAFFYLTVEEIPLRPPVRPAEAGIRVERWYERYSDGQPITSVAEGELVRVRLRVTVPVERRFVVVNDALPAGLEAVDLSLRTSTTVAGPGRDIGVERVGEGDDEEGDDEEYGGGWGFGRWESGWWSPWDFREMRDDRVVYSASYLWAGTWNMTYVARATTPGTFIRPPAHAEEMYNPGVNGRSEGGSFTVTARPPR